MRLSIKAFFFLNISVFFLLLLSSCTVVRDYPAQPFVYDTNIELQGTLKKDERRELLERLQLQLHDSVKPRSVRRLFGWERGPYLFYSRITNPPVFDSSHADRSKMFMRALLHTVGYYRDSIRWDTTVTVRSHANGPQQRTTVNFIVDPGPLYRLDSVFYTMKDTLREVVGTDTILNITGNDTIQRITDAHLEETVLPKGAAFSRELIAEELDRLTGIYRNNGYLRFSREDLIAVWDTVPVELLRPVFDPVEQIRQLELIQERRANPTADVEIRLRANIDTTHLIQYHIGNILVYPDLSADTAHYTPTLTIIDNFQIISFQDLFKNRVITENIYLRHGELYRQRDFLRTINRFNSIGAWRLTSLDPLPRANSDTVDFTLRLTPADKYMFDVNLEGSQNWGNVVLEGNLIGVNFGLQNRNFARGANLANSNFRYGTEITRRGFQNQQFSLGHNIFFPRFIFPYPQILKREWRENAKTVLSFNAASAQRRDFFSLHSFNTSWGYEMGAGNKFLSVRLPNIEYAALDIGPILHDLIAQNASYRYIFNGGLVTSLIASYSFTNVARSIKNTRFNLETSFPIIPSATVNRELHRFVKFDADHRRTYNWPRTAFAWRAFGGVGYRFINADRPDQRLMPFFKAYFAGGANSMRAWQLRRLGPGSAIRSFGRTDAPDRFGDIQLELNAEYRFFITRIVGFKVHSAIFTDMGNIWFLRPDPNFPGGEFKFKNLWHDLAIGLGTGLRVDFGFLTMRLDYAYKVKDPSPGDPALQNVWFPGWNLKAGEVQFGIGYPF